MNILIVHITINDSTYYYNPQTYYFKRFIWSDYQLVNQLKFKNTPEFQEAQYTNAKIVVNKYSDLKFETLHLFKKYITLQKREAKELKNKKITYNFKKDKK